MVNAEQSPEWVKYDDYLLVYQWGFILLCCIPSPTSRGIRFVAFFDLFPSVDATIMLSQLIVHLIHTYAVKV